MRQPDWPGSVGPGCDLVWSTHARRRANELGFSTSDLVQCVVDPEQSYCGHPAYGPDRRVYQRGDLAVVVHEPSRTVVTLLLRRLDRWEHGRDRRQAGRRVVARCSAHQVQDRGGRGAGTAPID